MDLQPLKDFVAKHHLETQPAFSLLDIMSELGEVAKELLKATDYGRRPDAADAERMREEIGDLMFAVAYLSTLYDVDPEAAMWESVRKFERRLERGSAGSEADLEEED
ncbi:MAG: nucleotide pyrophosphohydrolase [Armatimonadota bacterium]|nr:nucleotide pyrophosphohydrolase [Armatimonadota bacterium]